jgi:hypothetical protein
MMTRMYYITIRFSLIEFLMMNHCPLLIVFNQEISIFMKPIRATMTPEVKEDLILIAGERFQLVHMKTNISGGHHKFENLL